MKKLYLLLTFIGTYTIALAQQTERIVVYREDPHDLYAKMDADSSTLFYEKMVPSVKPIGVLVVMPGAGERIKETIQESGIGKLAVQKGFIVVFPSINRSISKHIHEHAFLDTIFKQVVKAHGVGRDRFVLGGFSGGGMVALSYTEKANREPGSTFVKPRAVFGVDPPLDYAHLWKNSEKNIERGYSPVAIDESKWIQAMYTSAFGGSPKQFPETYLKYSIFTYDDKDGGNAKYLVNTPVLLFTEPDILWQMENRRRDYYDLNCADISAMINLLRMKGNLRAHMIVTYNKGVRPDGQRHPHSWSIMDPAECLDWILGLM